PSTTTTTLPPGKTLFLYVSNSVLTNRSDPNFEQTVMRYDAFTGAPRGTLATDPTSAIIVPFSRPASQTGFIACLTEGPGNTFHGVGDLSIKRWDRTTGANFGPNGNPLSAYIATQGAAQSPFFVRIGPDGLLWVMNANTYGLYRVHPETGAFVSTIL